jgi:CubicO group peptidase (beta-lactamase class C family)
MGIASMTRAVTAVATLQPIEHGKLGIKYLVEDYIASWKNISVIDGFTHDGQP